jgi:outer membrane receptor protein involved in Fe transport
VCLLIGCASLFGQGATGTVSGFVLDSTSGRPLTGASVAVAGKTEPPVLTDGDGRFTLRLAPGTYTLAFSAEQYSNVSLTDVAVKAGEATEASTVMSNKSNVTTVDVVERVGAIEATAEAMLTERKLSAVVSDSISRSELASGTSSDAAGALEKVTGVSVVGDGFVYVRGLGERYSATQLNGALVPTTEPEKRVVPLDLFPTGMIENIKIAKTYSPDLPAEFAGGLVQMQTMEFPAQKHLDLSIKTGFNTRTTFDRFFTYPGGSSDFWGLGAGNRKLPAILSANQRAVPGQFNQQQLQEIGRAFTNIWQPTPVDSARPAFDWSASSGVTVGKWGIVGAFSFSNKPQFRSEVQRYIRMADATTPFIFTDYQDFREYSETARLGGLLNVAYRLTPNHKLIVRNTVTHDAEKSAREFSGYDGGVDGVISSQRLRFIERSVRSTSAEGEHLFSGWRNSLLHWQLTYSGSKRDEPDLREVIRNVLPDGRESYASLGSSGLRFFSGLDDRIYEPQVDFSVPFFKGAISGMIRTGVRATIRRRDFQARRFRYIPQQLTTLNLLLPSNELFAPANIRPTGFQIIEFTRGTDTYDARMDVYAGYSMIDLNLGRKWRVVAGVRVEDADQFVRTIDNQVPNAVPALASLQNRDPVPSVNVVYGLSGRQNLRASYSRTLSRPDFRELSPFDFNNVLGGFTSFGNPLLQRASIDNYDLRWELFPGGNQLVAASVFVKTFDSPIEQNIVPATDLRQTFFNAKAARNYGLELEVRQNLDRITPAFREFAVGSNFTLVDSNIEINPEQLSVLTTKSRPLMGQSRYVFNGNIQWARPKWRSNAQFLANYVSRRISDLGSFGVPDIYQEANTTLDFMYQYTGGERRKWSIRFEAENLADNNFQWTQGPFVQRLYRLGRTFQVGFKYSIF